MSSDASYSPPDTATPADPPADPNLPVMTKLPKHEPGLNNDDTYLTRPNRFFGPASTWLSWTEQERLVAQLLDQERAGDLGLHLVMARGLKRKAEREDLRRGKGRGKRRKGKGREGDEEEDEGEGNGLVRVPARWDAWPLGVREVPREDGGLGMYPSEKLEGCLVATATRLARERWRGREWAVKEPKEAKSGMMALLGSQKTDVEGSQNEEDVSDAAETLSSGPGSDSDTDTERDDVLGMTTSQTYLVDEPDEKTQGAMDKESKIPGRDEEGEDDPPTPIADDDEARNLLLPSIRNTMSKLDDLLLALHKARQSYAPTKRRGRAGSGNSDTDEGGSRIPRSRSRSRSLAQKRARSSSRGSETSVDSGKSDSRGPKRQLGLRDWSDVLGMAAVIGWDPDVLQRASERCATLFSENMMFRTFHEGSTRTNEPPYYEEHYAVQPAGEASDDEEDIESGTGPLVRSTIACEACTKNRRKCEPISSQAVRSSCKACVELGEECSGIRGKAVPKGLRCPFRFCERRHILFKKPGHLQRHLETVHNEDRPPPSSSPARSSASEGYLGSDEPPRCPVESCSRHERPFSEGSKLYRHIRKMHPEVDVKEVKRLETLRRGERRGRWRNESRRREIAKRNRSKSFGVSSSPPTDGTRGVIELD